MGEISFVLHYMDTDSFIYSYVCSTGTTFNIIEDLPEKEKKLDFCQLGSCTQLFSTGNEIELGQLEKNLHQ